MSIDPTKEYRIVSAYSAVAQLKASSADPDNDGDVEVWAGHPLGNCDPTRRRQTWYIRLDGHIISAWKPGCALKLGGAKDDDGDYRAYCTINQTLPAYSRAKWRLEPYSGYPGGYQIINQEYNCPLKISVSEQDDDGDYPVYGGKFNSSEWYRFVFVLLDA